MENYYRYFVFIHVITAAAFVMTLIIMQLVVSNMMKRVSNSDDKKKAGEFVAKKWLPIVDAIIITVGITGGLIAYTNWDMIVNSSLLLVKVSFGAIALSSAYTNHFIFKYVKRSLIASGNRPGLLKKINLIVPILNKTALIFGVMTALMGWYRNHL